MKYKYLIVFLVVGPLLSSRNLLAEDTNDTTCRPQDLVARINANMQAGKRHEAALADDLGELDALLAKHKGDKPEDVAQILLGESQVVFGRSRLTNRKRRWN